jgi:hypothetical protein
MCMCVCAGVCADWTEWLYMHFFFWFIGGRLMKFTTLACADAKEKNETFSAHTPPPGVAKGADHLACARNQRERPRAPAILASRDFPHGAHHSRRRMRREEA